MSGTVNIDFRHKENEYVDFDHDHLIFHMTSTEGPRLASGDVNGDGLEDFFIGNSKGSECALFIQHKGGTFKRSNEGLFKNGNFESTGVIFFDAEGDGDIDLYLAVGGNEYGSGALELADRLYLNDGVGNFSLTTGRLPDIFENTSCVVNADYDRDGDQDLFVGTRLKQGQYGFPASGYILNNDGAGVFTDVTADVAPHLQDLGLITSGVWSDIDSDGDLDLMVAGEWMPLTVLKQEKGRFSNHTLNSGLEKSNGFWNRIIGTDLDIDGDIDFVAGNHGLNSKFKAGPDKPLEMYSGDFDENGDVEQVICMYYGETSYPVVLRHDLVRQLQTLKKKYLKYEDYKDETIEDIFDSGELKKAKHSYAYELRTALLMNDGKGNFQLKPLPVEAQFSPVYGICVMDFDGDGNDDIFLGGNLYGAKPEVGRYDANHGQLFCGNGKGFFKYIPQNQSGLKIDGEIRDAIPIRVNSQTLLLIARNNDKLLIFQPLHSSQSLQ
jgi:hypothetical protein